MSIDNTTLPLATARCRLLAALLLSLTLTACGSGGGEQQAAAPEEHPVSEPVEQPDDEGVTENDLPVTLEPDPGLPSLPDELPSPPDADPVPDQNEVGVPVVGGGADGGPENPDQDTGVPVTDGGSLPVGEDQAPVENGGGDLVVADPTPDDNSPVDDLFGDDGNVQGSDSGEPVDAGDVGAVGDGGEPVDAGDVGAVDDSGGGAVDEPASGEIVADDSKDLDNLFGGSPSEPGSGLTSSSRELRWLLPSERMDGSQLASSDLQAFELWGAAADKPLEKWATLHPTTKAYSLAQIPSGRYRFALVTVDQHGLRSDLSAVVIRDLQ